MGLVRRRGEYEQRRLHETLKKVIQYFNNLKGTPQSQKGLRKIESS